MENFFSCQMANCTMSFDSEEQLTAHKKKHAFSLSLTPTSYKNPFILDQTPTPITQFCNPVSLELDDLQSDNPFDATFRKANSSSRASSNIVIPESSALISSLPDSEVLNTPSIILPSEPATPVSLKPCIPKNIKKNCDNQVTESSNTLPFTPNEPDKSVSPQQSTEDAELPSESANFSGVVPSNLDSLSDKEENNKKSTTSKNVLQTSVITSVGNTALLKNGAVGGVPTAVVVTRAPVNSVPTISMAQVVGPQVGQLKVQKTIPAVAQPLSLGGTTVLLSFVPETQTFFQIGNNLPTTVATIAPQVTSTTSNAKLKLKEVLTQNQKGGTSFRKSNTSKSKTKTAVLVQPDSSDGARMSSSPPSSPSFPVRKPGHSGRRRGDSFDDPDEKRKRSLERNRAAATRCREKRKMWIKNLEKKADELAETNVQLQGEVNLLRNEVAHLKMLLLEHKDCPVTLQQRASCHETEKETYTTVRIITSASDDVQRVPNVSVISPPSSDFMEMEVSSVQSSSDSLASETSETSYRER